MFIETLNLFAVHSSYAHTHMKFSLHIVYIYSMPKAPKAAVLRVCWSPHNPEKYIIGDSKKKNSAPDADYVFPKVIAGLRQTSPLVSTNFKTQGPCSIFCFNIESL